jgi:hypothetical protein
MKRMTISLLLLYLMTRAVTAQQPDVVPLMSRDLADIPGKEGLMITVEYPPGGSDPVHRHYAHAFVYVLEGSVVMQVKGGKEVTLTPGQTFYEGPDDGKPEKLRATSAMACPGPADGLSEIIRRSLTNTPLAG